MSNPLVSCIITTFNRAAMLPATLESVIAQDYPAKEIIVVDDGSTDDTAEVCARFPVLYLRQENRGPSAARNLGATRCSGGILFFLDDDDLCPTGTLWARVLHWQREPDSHHVMGRVRRFCERVPGRIEFIESAKEATHYMSAGAGLVTRKAFEQVGGFTESLRCSEDTDFFLRSREAGIKFNLIPEICLFYRRHPGNLTHNLDRSDKSLLAVLHMTMQRRRRQGMGG